MKIKIAARQALEATIRGIPLKEYAKSHRELREVLDKFAYESPQG